MKKSRSVFWPSVLIGIGVLTLLGTLGTISWVNLWAIVRLWPVFLIAMGLGLLLRARWRWLWSAVEFLTVALVVLAVVFAPQLGLVPAWGVDLDFRPGGRNWTSETREVGTFDAVSINYPAEVLIRQGDAEGLTVYADPADLARIRTQVRDGRLTIDLPGGEPRVVVPSRRTARFEITVRSLREVEAVGAARIRISGLQADRFAVEVSGAAAVEVSGTATQQEVQIAGAGFYEADDLQTQRTSIEIDGAGVAKVRAQQSLDVEINGAGAVEYFGHPRISKRIRGIGIVQGRGD